MISNNDYSPLPRAAIDIGELEALIDDHRNTFLCQLLQPILDTFDREGIRFSAVLQALSTAVETRRADDGLDESGRQGWNRCAELLREAQAAAAESETASRAAGPTAACQNEDCQKAASISVDSDRANGLGKGRTNGPVGDRANDRPTASELSDDGGLDACDISHAPPASASGHLATSSLGTDRRAPQSVAMSLEAEAEPDRRASPLFEVGRESAGGLRRLIGG